MTSSPRIGFDTTFWLCISPMPDGGTRFTGVASDRHESRARVELPLADAAAEIGSDAVTEAEFDPDGAVRLLRVMPLYAPKAPDMWFAELVETAAAPPATNLVAFVGDARPAGAFVDESTVQQLPAGSFEQIGALRWFPATGEVHQVYVQPQWRRRSIGTALIAASSMLGEIRDWSRMWAGGHRTELGEIWRNRSEWRDDAAPLTTLAPPMTPGS